MRTWPRGGGGGEATRRVAQAHGISVAVRRRWVASLARKGGSASVAEAAWLLGAGWGRDAPLAGVAVGPCCS